MYNMSEPIYIEAPNGKSQAYHGRRKYPPQVHIGLKSFKHRKHTLVDGNIPRRVT